jgi:hypothetical protein
MEDYIFWGSTKFLGIILTGNAQISARTTLTIIRLYDLHYETWNLEPILYIFYNSVLVHMLHVLAGMMEVVVSPIIMIGFRIEI